MKQKSLVAIISVVFIILLVAVSRTSVPGKRPLATPAAKRPYQILGFYEKGWNPMNYGLVSLKSDHTFLDFVSPFWYSVTTDGNVKTNSEVFDQQALDFLRGQRRIKIVPLFNNEKTTGVPPGYANPSTRAAAIKNIVRIVEKQKYDGANIDFQLVPPETRNQLTAFIADLSKELKARGKSLSMDVFPKVDVPVEMTGVYDYAALGKYVDFLTVMTYDRHSEGSTPGPVAPIGWVEKNIQYAVSKVPSKKVMLCVAAYGYDWPAGGGKAMSMGVREIKDLIVRTGAKVQWDNTNQVPFFRYTDKNGVAHQVWFENGDSVAKKVALVKKYKLKGIALWRLGYDDPTYWRKVLAAFK